MKKALTTLLLATLLLTTACSSVDDGAKTDTTASDTTSSDGALEVEGYKYYGDTDFGGETFTIYNVMKDLWGAVCVIQPDEVTGEVVNDTIYERNEFVKSKLNCEIKEINDVWSDMANNLQTQILAGSCEYDAVYIVLAHLYKGLTEGFYQNLNDISTLHLDEPYWDQIMLDSTSILGQNYCATSPAHLMVYDSMWCLYFNESMMDDLGMEYPYQLVRDGKWTFAEFEQYCKQAANLNGDESFAMSAEGNSIYGCTSYYAVAYKFLYGFGAQFAQKDADDTPYISCDSEYFITAAQRLAEFFSQEGVFLNASDTNNDTNYANFFDSNRTLFLGGEIMTSQRYRKMEDSIGILPYPKYDEAQESYHSTNAEQCAVFTIPVSNDSPEKVALLFDALSYESNESVIRPYFEILVEQKGLRNDNSIDMLHIITDTRSFDIGLAYRFANKIAVAIRDGIIAGSTDVASMIETNRNVDEDYMESVLEMIKNR